VRSDTYAGSAERAASAILVKERLVRRHRRSGLGGNILDVKHEVPQVLQRQRIDQRVISAGRDALAQHDCDPAMLREQVLRVLQYPSLLTKQLDLLLQRLGNAHLATVPPE